MSGTLSALLADIDEEAHRIAREARLSAYERHGGVFDFQVDHERMIQDLGVRRAALLSSRFVELRNAMRRLYWLNPARAVEHLDLLQRGLRQGWFKRGLGGGTAVP